MIRVLTTLFTLALIGSPALALPQPVRWMASVSNTPSKKDVLGKLKTIQDQQIQESTDLDNAIRKQLNETVQLDLTGDDLMVAGRRTNLVTKKIDELNKRRTELNARREIVDRLIFQIDSKWDGKSKLQDFLVATFLEMASTDLSDGRDNRLWKEFTYLSMVMREVPESNDDIVSIFEGYLKYSSVLEPKSPADFIASRNYTNGIESQQAHASSRDSAGDALPGLSKSTGPAPIVIKTSIAKDMIPQPPPPSNGDTVSGATTSVGATKALSGANLSPSPTTPASSEGATKLSSNSAAGDSASGTTRSAAVTVPATAPTPPVQATPAPPPHVAAQKTKNARAQALTGQAAGPAITAGTADSPKSLDKRDEMRDNATEKARSNSPSAN